MLAIEDPDAMYAAAISRLTQNPDFVGRLGPIAVTVWNAAKGQILKVGEELAGKVADEVIADAGAVLGPAVASEIAGLAGNVVGAVADLVPFIGTVVQIVELGVAADAQAHAQAEAVYKAEAANALGRPIIGHGSGGAITPADIFARDPSDKPYQGSDVYSTLGQAFVGITEGQLSDSAPNAKPILPGQGLYDAPLSHAGEALDSVLPDAWRDVVKMNAAGFGAGLLSSSMHKPPPLPPEAQAEMGVGIPRQTRLMFELLRRAMGAQPKDAGASLWPIYLDLLLAEIDAGRLTPNYAKFLLGFYWRDPLTFARFGDTHGVVTDEPHDSNPMGDGSPGPYAGPSGFDPFVDQIWRILDNWRHFRADPAILAHLKKGPIHLTFPKKAPKLAGLVLTPLHLGELLGSRTPTQQAAIDAFAATLGLPPGHY